MMRRAPKPKAIVCVQCRHNLIRLRPTIEGKAMRWKNFCSTATKMQFFFAPCKFFHKLFLQLRKVERCLLKAPSSKVVRFFRRLYRAWRLIKILPARGLSIIKNCNRTNNLSRREPLHAPKTVVRARVEKPIVQASGTTLPKLYRAWFHAVSAPKRRAGNIAPLELRR